MKRILPSIALILFSAIFLSLKSQNIYIPNEAYIMLGKDISGRIINEAGLPMPENFNEVFKEIIAPADYVSLEVPFYTAKGSSLQRVIRITFADSNRTAMLTTAFNAHASVEYAERVPLDKVEFNTDDLGQNSLDNQWHLYKVMAMEAWDISRGSKDILVAIVDDAMQITHPDLKDNVWVNKGEIAANGIDDDGNGYIDDINGWDAGDRDNNPMPQNNNYTHGTHVGGITGASTNNNIGVASMGFNISLIAVKSTILNQTNPRTIPRGYEGITYAANAGAHIINCSWGSTASSQTNRSVIQYAQGKGSLVVAAMGNEGLQLTYYPASYTDVISVASTANNDTRSTFSNYASYTTISAPGNQIRSTIPYNTYDSYSGTSMATPLVSGLLALMKSHYPDITNADLKACMIRNADDIYPLNNPVFKGRLGAGRINAKNSMLCVDSMKTAANNPVVNSSVAEKIYPNPSTGKITISDDAGVASYTIYQMDGKNVASGTVEGAKIFQLQLEGYGGGLFVVEWHDNSGNVRRERVFISK